MAKGIAMKYFVDGNQLVITKDDFVNLQESPAIFFPLESGIAETILKAGTIIALPIDDLIYVRNMLFGVTEKQEQEETKQSSTIVIKFTWKEIAKEILSEVAQSICDAMRI